MTTDYSMFLIPKNGGNIVTIEKTVKKWHNKLDKLQLTAIYKTKFDNKKLYFINTNF